MALGLRRTPLAPLPIWRSAASDDPILREDEVHVWDAALDRAVSGEQDLGQILSPDERARHFRRAIDGRRFIIARGLLRSILARYLREDPASLRFRHNPYGKPALAGDARAKALRFNVSHSDGICLYAISWNREVGIDIERIRRGWALDRMADRFFSPNEATRLHALPEDARPEAFFRYWTHKEAYLKARGWALAVLDLSSKEHDHADRQSALLDLEAHRARVGACRVEELSVLPGYAAAVAAEGQDWQVRRFDVDDPG